MAGRQQRAAVGYCNTETHQMHIFFTSALWSPSATHPSPTVRLLDDFAEKVHLKMSVGVIPNIDLLQQKGMARL